MLLSEKSPGRAAKNPLPPKLAALIREFRWFALLGLALFLALSLFTYDRADPGWSHGLTEIGPIRNAGGRVGAWIADVMLLLFGLSAYWWVIFGGAIVWWGFHRIEAGEVRDRRSYAVAAVGFAVVLAASCGLEAIRLYSLKAVLPQAPGGMLGAMFGGALAQALGYTGATLILLVLLAAGLSLFSGVSWLSVIERLGGWVETAYALLLRKWQEREDRRAGAQATIEREEVVEVSKKKLEIHEPIRIEPPAAAIPKSARVEREKQVPLFENLPDTMLPPLSLLDEPEKNLEVLSAETLEFTSRLIEKKLLDFGVEVKVVAAYPGPVITRFEIEPAVGVKGSQIINLVKDLARALSVVSIRVIETIPGKSLMGLEIPNPTRQIVRLSEILSSEVYASDLLSADARPRQGHRRQPGRRRPAAHAAPPDRRHHRLGQVRRDQCHAAFPGLQVSAIPGETDLDRPQDARVVGLRGHSAPAGAGRHRHASGRERAQLVRRGDGPPLQADERARRAQHGRPQSEGARGGEGQAADTGSACARPGDGGAAARSVAHRRRHRRAGRSHDGRGQEAGGAGRAAGAEGARGRHTPHAVPRSARRWT